MKSIRLENVKAFVDTKDVEIAPISIFVGRNSCGKSSFIRFPQVLAQTFSSGMDTPIYLNGTHEDSIDYGAYKEVLHNGKGDGFTVSITYPFDYSIVDNYEEKKGIRFRRINEEDYSYDSDVTIKITYSKPSGSDGKPGRRVYASKIELFVDGLLFSRFNKIGATKEYLFYQERTVKNRKLTLAEYSYKIKSNIIQNFMPTFSPIEVAEAIYRTYNKTEGPVSYEEFSQILDYKSYIDPTTNYAEKENYKIEVAKEAYAATVVSMGIFGYVYDLMQREMLKLKYIGPFRAAPKRYYRVDEIEHDQVGVLGDYTSSLLINSEDDLKNEVSGWFEDAFGSSIKVNPVGEGTGLYTITATDNSHDSSEDNGRNHDPNGSKENGSNLMDVGYGFSQVLPIVTQLKKSQIEGGAKRKRKYYSKYSEIIIIEQPELHLHPAAQSKLASLFASAVCDGENGEDRKLMIETHSEHLIRALQYLIASKESKLTKEMVRFYYIDKTLDGSVINEMKTNELGQFVERWPKGFFDETQEMSKKLMNAIADAKSSRNEAKI